jgi:DNA-binding NtrC family response regulator
MKEESMLVTMRPTGRPDSAEYPYKAAKGPGNGNGSRSLQTDDRGAIPALAFSLDNLYGCLELINEGRPAPLMRVMKDLERDIISQAMIAARANMSKAAILLGIKYTTLYAKIKKHGLQFSKAVRFDTNGADLDI